MVKAEQLKCIECEKDKTGLYLVVFLAIATCFVLILKMGGYI